VVSAESDQVLGRDCKTTTVNRMSQPVLIAPPDESEVPDAYPVFTWMASVPPGPGQRILYELRVHEMFATQTPQDAVARNPAFLGMKGLSRTILQYPVSSRRFTVGQTYAWFVVAYEQIGSSLVTLGTSEVWSFTYRPFTPDTVDGGRRGGPAITAETDVCPGENWDFEIGSLACWTVEGEAFADDPVKGAHAVLGELGHNGRFWVTSHGFSTGDAAMGRMQSQEIRLKNTTVAFLAGGVSSPDAAVELYVERVARDTFTLPTRKIPGSPGEYYVTHSTSMTTDRRMRSGASERLVPFEWDVERFSGRLAYVIVKDSSKVAHISIDQFRFYDRDRVDSIKLPVLVMSAGERHSLAATPQERSSAKLVADLGVSATEVQKGKRTIPTESAVGQTATITKARKSVTSAAFTGTETMESLPAFNVNDVKSDETTSAYAKGLALAALDPKNSVWAWGDNLRSAVSRAFGSVVPEPRTVSKVANVIALAAGMDRSFAVEKGGTVKGWGFNDYGQLGVGDRETKGEPTSLPGLSKVTDVAAGSRFSMALTSTGDVYVWGYNRTFECGFPSGTFAETGQLASIDHPSTPRAHGMLKGIRAIAAGHSHAVVVTMSGQVAAWGVNGNGQTGLDDDLAFIPVPWPVSLTVGGPSIKGGPRVVDVAAGDAHSMALTNTGDVYTWGNNASGQLGDGTTVDRFTPKKVEGLTNIRAIAAGGAFSLALDSSGTVWAWGNNILGQLGDGTRYGRPRPVKVKGLDAVQGIVAGGAHAMAVRADGSLWTWGQNGLGQLGEGPVADLAPIPAEPPIRPARVERLAAP
jgi:alpha-tubulin suppressor-like RCC1 family protein